MIKVRWWRYLVIIFIDESNTSWLSGAVLTTWSLTHSKQWRWSWTSGETPLLSPHSTSWTALWLQWSHSGSWAPPSGSQDLKWDNHIDSIVKKAQQRLYFLRQLRKFNLPQELLKQFYSAIIESVLCTSITVWFSSATKSNHRRLRRVVRTAERIIGTTLPTLQELYLSRGSKRAILTFAFGCRSGSVWDGFWVRTRTAVRLLVTYDLEYQNQLQAADPFPI